MILDELKVLIKDFETVLSKDLRFKKDMYFKNQVKIIYGTKKINNVLIPMMVNNVGNSNLPKCQTNILPSQADCPKCKAHVCPSCPKCTTDGNSGEYKIGNLGEYERGHLKESNEMTKVYLGLPNSSSEEEDLDEIYKIDGLSDLPLKEQIAIIRKTEGIKVQHLTDEQIIEQIKKYQKH